MGINIYHLSLAKLHMSVVLKNANDFTHILRMQNTNVDGKVKVMFALRVIQGIGRRFANLVCKVANIDLNRRAGELNEAEMNKIADVIAKPLDYGIPKWFLNRQRCIKDGTYSQLISNMAATRFREDLERMKKMRLHRGLRHWWGIKVRDSAPSLPEEPERLSESPRRRSEQYLFLPNWLESAGGTPPPALTISFYSLATWQERHELECTTVSTS